MLRRSYAASPQRLRVFRGSRGRAYLQPADLECPNGGIVTRRETHREREFVSAGAFAHVSRQLKLYAGPEWNGNETSIPPRPPPTPTHLTILTAHFAALSRRPTPCASANLWMSQAPNALKVPLSTIPATLLRPLPSHPFGQAVCGRWDPDSRDVWQLADVYVIAQRCPAPDRRLERLVPGTLTRDFTASHARSPPKYSRYWCHPRREAQPNQCCGASISNPPKPDYRTHPARSGLFPRLLPDAPPRRTDHPVRHNIGQPRWRPGCRPYRRIFRVTSQLNRHHP